MNETIGEAIDRLFKMREERLDLQKQVDTVKAEETALHEEILKTFDKSELEGARGKVATASVTRRVVANVEDWDKLYKYIAENEAFDLLQRRVNDKAYRDRIEDGKEVPGAVPFTTIGLSLVKAGK